MKFWNCIPGNIISNITNRLYSQQFLFARKLYSTDAIFLVHRQRLRKQGIQNNIWIHFINSFYFTVNRNLARDLHLYCDSVFSIRASGISQTTATTTYSPQAASGCQKATGIAKA